ncbi:hypothetical protein [Methylobacterium sp. J-090]|uniref:hypothetical protein n=1 Tax=Methylobacterium sp. J-090 TaxID=2836666 RepID=UPI001FBB0768|nr:hypothetical protein [Methylobacterium sp. J-090]MCJ2083216.1 hypothetical protein [Methylobacterium sp. J-090]
MSTLTSTLAIRVDDAGLASRLRADAEALKKFGASASQIKATAGGADLLKQFGQLQAAAGKLDGFAAASRGLDGLGARLRAARDEVCKTARALVAAERKAAFFDRSKASGSSNYPGFVGSGAIAEAAAGLKAARRANAAAIRAAAGVESAFTKQRIAVRGAGRELERAGTPLADISKAQRKVQADIEAVTVAVRRQVAAHEASGTAAAASGIEASRRAKAQLRATVAAGRQARADREHAEATEASRRANAGRDLARGMGGAGRRQSSDIEGSRRMTEGMSRPARQTRARADGEALAEARAHAEAERERDRHVRRNGVLHAASAGAAGYVGVHGVSHGIGHSVRAGARLQHERVMLQNAGRTPAEMKEIEEHSERTSRAVPHATFEENLKVVNETVGAFGDLHHALENLTFVQKATAVVHAAAGGKITDSAGEMGNKTARFFEMRGTAGNTAVFQREAGEMVRAMAFSGGNFNPAEMLNFGQQAKAALPLYSERFLTKIAPSMVTEFGGDRAGTAANAFRSVIMGRANDQKQAEAWVDAGLLDKKQARIKGGHVVSWNAGAVKDTNKALSDPLEWAETVLIPALQKKGVNTDDKLELSKALGTMFRNSNSNLFAEALTQQMSRTRLHKDEANINQSDTMAGMYARNLSKDATEGYKALKAGMENLISTASSPLMESAAGGMKRLAGGLQDLAVMAKDHPSLAVAGGGAVAAGGLAGAGLLSYKLMTGFGLGTSATALTASAASLDAAAVALAGKGAVGTAATVAAPAAAATAGAGLSLGLGGVTVAAGAIYGAIADALTPGTNGGIIGAIQGKESSLAQSMRVMRQERERSRGTFEGKGSLPPGRAGMPAPAPVRLPGLDGRPAPAAIPATIAPKVEAGGLDGLHARADELRASLEKAGATTVAPQADSSGLSSTLSVAKDLLATLQAIPGAISSASNANALAGIRARANAGSSFSDGITAGP